MFSHTIDSIAHKKIIPKYFSFLKNVKWLLKLDEIEIDPSNETFNFLEAQDEFLCLLQNDLDEPRVLDADLERKKNGNLDENGGHGM